MTAFKIRIAAISFLIVAHSLVVQAEPFFENSVVSDEDPVTLFNIEFLGWAKREMPDKRSDELFADNTYVFKAVFEDLFSSRLAP